LANGKLRKVIKDNKQRDMRLKRNEYIGFAKSIFKLAKFTRVRRPNVACFLSPLRLYLLGSGLAGPSDTCSSAAHNAHTWSSSWRVRLVRGLLRSICSSVGGCPQPSERSHPRAAPPVHGSRRRWRQSEVDRAGGIYASKQSIVRPKQCHDDSCVF